MISLYKPDEYPVFVGNQNSASALCIVWQDIDRIVQYFPQVAKKFSIIGNLRSPFGINIALYNLARNPQIHTVYIWGPDALSNTDIGRKGSDQLFELWRNDSFEKLPEIDTDTLDLIRKHVSLIHWKKNSPPDLENQSNTFAGKPYMKPVLFPPFEVRTPKVLPSEKYSFHLRSQTGADGFLRLLHSIWKYGQLTKIDQEGQKVKEIRGAIVVIEDETIPITIPDWLEKHPAFGVTRDSAEEYTMTQFSNSRYLKEIYPNTYEFVRPKDYSYLYAELLYAFPRPMELDKAVNEVYRRMDYKGFRKFILNSFSSNIKNDIKRVNQMEKVIQGVHHRKAILTAWFIPSVNQVEYVINRIKNSPDDLDKEINLWDVRKNIHLRTGRPCLNKLSFSVRHGFIDLHAFFRSHDITKAWFYNYYGIRSLQQYVASRTGYKLGYLILESESAHIYERDFARVNDFVNTMITKKEPRMFFDPILDSDKRGSLFIKVVNKTIIVTLQDPQTGNKLFELKGSSSRKLIYLLRHYDLISRTDHALFIGSELAKAETCLKRNIVYRYDSAVPS